MCEHLGDAEPEPVASSTSDATVRDAKHASVPLRRVRAGEVRREEFLYELKAGPAGGLRPPSGPATTRRSLNCKVTTRSGVLHFTTRKVRCVTPAPSITLVRSRSIGPVPRWSNNADAAPEQDGHQVDVDLVQESRSDALLHDARGAHPDVLVASDRFGLLQGALQSVGDEGERRSFVDPLWWDRAADNKDRHIQGVVATPPMGEVEGPSTKHQRPGRFARLAEELGGLGRDPEDHVGSRQPVVGVASAVPGHEPLAADPHGCFRAVVRPTDKPVERDCEPGADLPHVRPPFPYPAAHCPPCPDAEARPPAAAHGAVAEDRGRSAVAGWRPCQRDSCRPGPASPIARAGAFATSCEAWSFSPAVPSPCHSEHDATGSSRSTTATHGPLTCRPLITGARQHEW